MLNRESNQMYFLLNFFMYKVLMHFSFNNSHMFIKCLVFWRANSLVIMMKCFYMQCISLDKGGPEITALFFSSDISFFFRCAWFSPITVGEREKKGALFTLRTIPIRFYIPMFSTVCVHWHFAQGEIWFQCSQYPVYWLL